MTVQPEVPAVKERIFVSDLSDDENATIQRLLDRLEAKRERNYLRACYYDGKRAIKQVGSIIPPHYFRLGLVLGWSGKAVDTLARRCNLESFVWSDGDLDSLGFSDVYDGNNLKSEVDQGLVSSLIHATSFVITTKGGAGEPPALVHFKDAMNATGEWNPRRRGLDNLISVTDRDNHGKVAGFVLYLDGLTIPVSKVDGAWVVEDRSEHPWGVPAEPLAYKPRLGRPFGSSRISRTVMSLHDQALRTVIRLEGHMDVYSFPEMWMLGADESIFKNPDGTQKAAWQVMLGRIKGIPDDEDATTPRADVKQFAASDPSPQLAALKQQAMLFSGETSIPLTSLGVSDMSNPTSADSYVASREDLIAEAEGATDDWSGPLRRSMVRALAMANGLDAIPAEWKSIDTKWRSPMYLSRAAQADAGMKQLTAAPWLAETEVGLELLGLSEQQIDRALADRRRNAGTQALASILERTSGDASGPTAS